MALKDQIADLNLTIDTIAQDVVDVAAEIKDLKDKVAAGGTSPEDLAALQAAEDKLTAAEAALKAAE